MLDPTLRATLEQRVAEIGLGATLEASPTETIKPSVPRPGSSQRIDPSRLPRISLSGASAEGAAPSDAHHASDLELLQLLGEGGMGRVFAARQHSLAREVAVKTLRARASGADAASLLREAVVTGTLEHPGIVPVHALGVDDGGAPVLVMKRIEGVAWAALIDDPAHPAWSSRRGERAVAHVEIAMQVCRTLEFAHARGVLHRDVKPENVMLGEFGETYLVDWGIATRLDEAHGSSRLAGTPAYMAPEMVTGGALDARSDVFLVGASLHEALTGTPRHQGSTVMEVLARATDPAPSEYDESVPAELGGICNRATARDPAARFPSIEALRLALAEHLRHRASIALAHDAGERRDELARMLADAPIDAAPENRRRAYELVSEGRFGFTQALREWAGNEVARRGLEEHMALAIDLELRQGHLETAEAMLRDSSVAPPALTERLARLRAAAERAKAEHERLRALDRDHDSSLGSRQRIAVLALFGATTVGTIAYATYAGAFRPSTMLVIAIAFSVVGFFTIFLFRRQLLANAFGKSTAGVFLVGTAGLAVSRGAGVLRGASFAEVVTQDLLVLAAVAACGALTLMRWMWPVAALSALCAVWVAVSPGAAQAAFSIVVLSLPALLYFALRMRSREGARDKP